MPDSGRGQRVLTVPQIIGAVSGAAYVFGFLVETLYLGSQGFFTLDLLRVQYVFVGFTFLLFVLSPSLGCYFAGRVLLEVTRDKRFKTPTSALVVGFPLMALVGLVGAFFGAYIISGLDAVSLTLEHAPTIADPSLLFPLITQRLAQAPISLSLGFVIALYFQVWNNVPHADRRPWRIGFWRIVLHRWRWLLLCFLFAVVFSFVVATASIATTFALGEVKDTVLQSPSLASPLFVSALGVGIELVIVGSIFSTVYWGANLDRVYRVKGLLLPKAIDDRITQASQRTRSLVQDFLWVTVPMLLTGAVATLWLYSALVFPQISRAVGGGAPQPIVVSAQKVTLPALFSSSEHRVLLVHQTSQYLILQVKKGQQVVDRIVLPVSAIDYYHMPDESQPGQ